MKRMKESLKVAAEIREQLKGRHHSDSTPLVREDRSFNDDSLDGRELALEDLLANLTEDNSHAEVDFGPPVGEEEW